MSDQPLIFSSLQETAAEHHGPAHARRTLEINWGGRQNVTCFYECTLPRAADCSSRPKHLAGPRGRHNLPGSGQLQM
jgi:hypothetical protein